MSTWGSSGCLDGSLLVVNGETHERLEGHGVQVTEIAFAPNGKWLASIDRNGNLIIRLTKVDSVDLHRIWHRG